jgi:hypothetical protein
LTPTPLGLSFQYQRYFFDGFRGHKNNHGGG